MRLSKVLGEALRGVDVDELLGTACVAQGLLLSTYNIGTCLRSFAWVPPMPSRLRARSPARPLPIWRDRCPGRIRRLTAHLGWGRWTRPVVGHCPVRPAQSATTHEAFSCAETMRGWIDGVAKAGGSRREVCLPCSSVTSVVSVAHETRWWHQ